MTKASPTKASPTKISLFMICAAAAFSLASATDVRAQARPSWCSSASLNLPESTICKTQGLWGKDDQLTIIYKGALNSVGKEKARLEKSEEDWLRVTRNGCNSDDSCLADVYDRRIDTLRRIDNRGYMNPNE
jgi:uncharacterized protein